MFRVLCSAVDVIVFLSFGGGSFFTFRLKIIYSFLFCVCACVCACVHMCVFFGWWPKEPAGLKTLRLVSMPSWRHRNSEDQEEEDDDDVVGFGVPAPQLARQGHQRGQASQGLQVAWSPVAFSFHQGIWVPKKVVKIVHGYC